MSPCNLLKIILELFNILFLGCNSVSTNNGFSLIFESLVNKIWFDSFPIFPISTFFF